MTDISLTRLGLAFLEGIGLILSPCILPILPIMLAASLDGGRARPFGIIVGFTGSFAIFALLARQLFSALAVDQEIVRNAALILLLLFGIMMLSGRLGEKFLTATQGLANLGQGLTARWDHGSGFWSGIGIGSLIGLVWTPCAGPILAVALVQVIQAKTSLEAILTILMFALGTGAIMLCITLFGREYIGQMNFFKRHALAVRRGLGAIIIAVALLIYSGADVALLAQTADVAPMQTDANATMLARGLERPVPAPEIDGIEAWINSRPLKLADLRGKVVLIDFWTYSCINCVRTLPYLRAWHEKYHAQGFEIIGIHAPEFDFEKKLSNVQNAVNRHNIRYPVALDNKFATWNNYSNRYWPAHYLIDRQGRIVYTHFGEGKYDITENNIRVLLGADKIPPAGPVRKETTAGQTPETYLGYVRADRQANADEEARNKNVVYGFPETLARHSWALADAWRVAPEYIQAVKPGAALRLNFHAGKVFLVLGADEGKAAQLRVLLNGKPALVGAGKDVRDGLLTIDRESIYEILDLDHAQDGLLELQAVTSGIRAYAFTFGG